jgi:ATP-dependent helicase/nuclease subunit B
LYAPYKDKALTTEAFAVMQKLAEEAVMKGFAKKYKGSDINFGKNHLLVNVAKLIVKRFLRFEKSAVDELAREKKEMRLLWTEERVTGHVTVNAGGRKLDVNLKGFIDRVDRFGGTLRIIDYKSGTALNKNLEVPDWEDLFSNPDLDMAFQLLMYSYLLKGRFRNGYEVSAGVIPLRKLNNGLMTAGVPESEGTADLIGEGSLKRFEEVVVKILETAFDQAIPFSQTENIEVCKRCPYVNLCRR